MKVTDLALGDWVSLDGAPIQVAGLHGRKVGVHKRRRSIYCSWHLESEFQPIPITLSFLLKNGFEHQMPYNDYVFENRLSLYECGEGFAIVGGYGVCNERLQVDYVHELQHLLRLIGVEKDFEL